VTAVASVDVESALVAWTRDRFPGARVVTELPATLADSPTIQITRIGGADRHPGIDAAVMDYDCFAPTRQAARQLALDVHDAWRQELPGSLVDGGVILAVATGSAPSWRPYENTHVRRFGGTHQVTVHAQRRS
jgi:hypothetical protein